jgi:hypothetical protein
MVGSEVPLDSCSVCARAVYIQLSKKTILDIRIDIVCGEDYIVLYEFHKSSFTDNAGTKFSIYLNVLNQDCLICIVTRLQTSNLENWDKFSEESFFFSAVSKLALEHTEPSQMGTLDPFSLRVKWQ